MQISGGGGAFVFGGGYMFHCFPNESVRWDAPLKNRQTKEICMISRKQRIGAEIWVYFFDQGGGIFQGGGHVSCLPKRTCSAGCTIEESEGRKQQNMVKQILSLLPYLSFVLIYIYGCLCLCVMFVMFLMFV